jgi:hypothetical protein
MGRPVLATGEFPSISCRSARPVSANGVRDQPVAAHELGHFVAGHLNRHRPTRARVISGGKAAAKAEAAGRDEECARI